MNRYLSMHKNLQKAIIILMLPFIFTGCLRVPSYNPKPLTILSGRFNATSIQKHVAVRVKMMHKKDVTDLFGKRGSWLMRTRRSSLIPLHISIDNHSKHSLVLDPHAISLETLSYEHVCRRMSSNGGMWALSTLLLGYPAGLLLTIGGFFAIPIGSGVGSPVLFNAGWAAFAAGFGLMIATPFVAMGNAIQSVEANKELELDLYQKILKPNTIIPPYEHFETIVFVKRSQYKHAFTITLHAVDDSETTYTAHVKL